MGGGLVPAGVDVGGSKSEKGRGSDTPVSMDVDQVLSMNQLRTVTAKNLDSWIADNLQPSPAFSRQVKETVWQICEFLKRDCFGDGIHVQKTVKVSAAHLGGQLTPLLPPFPMSHAPAPALPQFPLAAPGMVVAGPGAGSGAEQVVSLCRADQPERVQL